MCRQAPHVCDQRGGHRVGLVPVGQRDNHRVAGGAVDEGKHHKFIEAHDVINGGGGGRMPGGR